jgi:hypothetical protein
VKEAVNSMEIVGFWVRVRTDSKSQFAPLADTSRNMALGGQLLLLNMLMASFHGPSGHLGKLRKGLSAMRTKFLCAYY